VRVRESKEEVKKRKKVKVKKVHVRYLISRWVSCIHRQRDT